ncbi:hypothetical protein V5F53_02670 [Xanthobacter sp. V4C-4]|uniref:hypothetical protein n=1 Tax=Xanthobacter cornucopiae TaxID=3119924 RepID=UPI00372B11D5
MRTIAVAKPGAATALYAPFGVWLLALLVVTYLGDIIYIPGLFQLILWIGPFVALIAGIISMMASKNKYKKYIKQKMEESLGGQIQYYDYDNSFQSAIGITDRSIGIIENGTIRLFEFDLIRDVWWEVPGWNREIVRGIGPTALSGGIMATLGNMAAEGQARNNSGMMFKLADIQTPIVKFSTQDVSILRKWEEIMRQALEGNDIKS